MLTTCWTKDVSWVRDERQYNEACPFVASGIVAHLRKEGLMSHVHPIKCTDGSDYLLIHASGLSFVRSCQSWK